jgi:endonuclease/exonuclease/phosphatase family metal-dependent hydrolase
MCAASMSAVKLHSGPPWSRISDHAALTARLALRTEVSSTLLCRRQ